MRAVSWAIVTRVDCTTRENPSPGDLIGSAIKDDDL